MNIYILEGIISPHEGSHMLGTFESLEKAIEGRKEFRTSAFDHKYGDPYEFYEIYETELNKLYVGFKGGEKPKVVDSFEPSKTNQRKGME